MSKNKAAIKSKKAAVITNLFNGKFDVKYYLSKAERDFKRMKSATDLFKFKDSLIDFSITIKHVAEWSWHEIYQHKPKWAKASFENFLNWVKAQSPEYLVFDEIANTVKHHTRNRPNKALDQIQLRPDFKKQLTDQDILNDCLFWSIGKNKIAVLPVIKTSNGELYRLLYVGKKALANWRKLVKA